MSAYGSFHYGYLAYETGTVFDGAAAANASTSTTAAGQRVREAAAADATSTTTSAQGVRVREISATATVSTTTTANVFITAKGSGTISVATTLAADAQRIQQPTASAAATATPSANVNRVQHTGGQFEVREAGTVTAHVIYLTRGLARFRSSTHSRAVCDFVTSSQANTVTITMTVARKKYEPINSLTPGWSDSTISGPTWGNISGSTPTWTDAA